MKREGMKAEKISSKGGIFSDARKVSVKREVGLAFSLNYCGSSVLFI